MESFKSLMFSWCNNIATNFDYNVVSLLMALFAGVMAMKIASRINDAHIRDEYEDDEKRPGWLLKLLKLNWSIQMIIKTFIQFNVFYFFFFISHQSGPT